MRKILLLMAAAMIAVPAFTQDERERWEGNRQMAVTLSPMPLFIGTILGGFGINVGFEYAPGPFASAKLNVHYIGIDPSRAGFVYLVDSGGGRARASLLRLNLEGRWYPQGNYVAGWFVNGGMQFHRMAATVSISFDDEDEEFDGGINSWSAFAGAGYKIIFRSDHRHAFVLEPSLDFAWRIASDMPDNIPMVGWLVGINGVRFNFLLGMAF